MMKRRAFIKGALAAAVSAALPALPSDGYQYTTHSIGWTITAEELENDGSRMAAALAKSMMQTKEVVTANVFNKAFGDMVDLNKLHYGVSGEGARRSVGAGGSPGRV